ncbi:MAG: hypothetical protein IPM35_36075 [Myxococcales bacterium]|nr:hypothetical protein [Myxococcales bacterium]
MMLWSALEPELHALQPEPPMPDDHPAPHPKGALASVDTSGLSFAVVGVGLVFVLMGAGAAAEGVYLLTVFFGLPGAFFAVLAVGARGRLVLTKDAITHVRRPNTFAKQRVEWSVPLSELAAVRTWKENRKAAGSSSYHSVQIVQVRDTKGGGYRVTRQYFSARQLDAFGRALEPLGFRLELLERAPG